MMYLFICCTHLLSWFPNELRVPLCCNGFKNSFLLHRYAKKALADQLAQVEAAEAAEQAQTSTGAETDELGKEYCTATGGEEHAVDAQKQGNEAVQSS
jgi:hypothetical protein